MLIASGNFIFGNRAVQEIPAFTLVFWRTSIGALFLLPIALLSRGHIIEFIKQNKLKTFALVLSGLVLPPWFGYMALNSPKLIDISVGVLAIPLMTIIFSVLLLNERLSYLQILGLLLAFFGSIVFAFHGDLEHLRNFDPHIEFLWILVASTFGSLYLVLLKRWGVHPSPSEGLFGLFLVATIILLPGFIHHAMTDLHPLEYSRGLWGSVLFVGIGTVSLPHGICNQQDWCHDRVPVHTDNPGAGSRGVCAISQLFVARLSGRGWPIGCHWGIVCPEFPPTTRYRITRHRITRYRIIRY